MRALKDLAAMAKLYDCDISRPAANAQEAVQWTYLAYLGAIKEANGAAMSIGRISSFLDIYIERDLREGALDETGAQELWDQLVQKLRIVRFLRTPDYDALFSGDPYWATECVGGMDLDGRTLVTRSSYRMLHTLKKFLVRRPSRTSRFSGRKTCRRPSSDIASRPAGILRRCSMKTMISCGRSGATTTALRVAYRRCGSASRCSSSALA